MPYVLQLYWDVISNGNVMLYDLVGILEAIGHENIIHFCYYNSNRSRCSGIFNGNVIGFWFSFRHMFGSI